jgi:glycosyltransferase involved in cell wall biosynthesis
MLKKICFTVTNDLSYDQRMQRICTTLHHAGYEVTLIGRLLKNSQDVSHFSFQTHRIPLFFQKGKLFYIEYNIKLFFYLLKKDTDAYCAIDLDTIIPNYGASLSRNKLRVYDAHELFCEMEEIISRKYIYKFWSWVERYFVPKYQLGYTIGHSYAAYFHKKYNVNYSLVRNATVWNSLKHSYNYDSYIFYQGAVNEGRCFEQLIPAMKYINRKMIICGSGNFYTQTKKLIHEHGLADKIQMMGYLSPQELKEYTSKACIGITLFTRTSKSNYYSLANRFFDYMHHGVPQLAPAFPEYIHINQEYEVASLIEEVTPEQIAQQINALLHDEEQYKKLHYNAINASKNYCWQSEEKRLISFYNQIFE